MTSNRFDSSFISFLWEENRIKENQKNQKKISVKRTFEVFEGLLTFEGELFFSRGGKTRKDRLCFPNSLQHRKHFHFLSRKGNVEKDRGEGRKEGRLLKLTSTSTATGGFRRRLNNNRLRGRRRRGRGCLGSRSHGGLSGLTENFCEKKNEKKKMN